MLNRLETAAGKAGELASAAGNLSAELIQSAAAALNAARAPHAAGDPPPAPAPAAADQPAPPEDEDRQRERKEDLEALIAAGHVLRFSCSNCNKTLVVRAKYAGREGECRRCGTSI